MSVPGLSPQRRATLALGVAVCLSFASGTAVVSQTCQHCEAASKTAPQVSTPTHPAAPAVADGTRKGSGDSLNLLPKPALLPPAGRLSPGEEVSFSLHDFAADVRRASGFAAIPVRAPPDYLGT